MNPNLSRREGEELYVEVKGTRTAGTGIIVTRGEVEFARNEKNVLLFIVSNVNDSHKSRLRLGTD